MESETIEPLPLDERQVELPDEVADAWAAVLIDIYEKQRERTGAKHEDADTAA